MHWKTACADCGQTLRLQDRLARSILCPRCGSTVTARPPRETPVVPSSSLSRRYLPWVLGVGLGFALALACVAAIPSLPTGRSTKGTRPPPGMPIPPATNGTFDPHAGGPKHLQSDPLRPPRQHYQPLALPDTIDSSLDLLTQKAPPLKSAGRIAPLLALAGGPDGDFLTADSDGVLRCYTASLELRGETRLDRIAYQMTLDAKRGRLYAAVTYRPWLRLSPLGDRDQAMGDLCVYDVSSLLAGQPPPAETKPLHTLTLESQVNGMHLSEDGAWLCYLVDSLNGAHVGRVATDSMECQKRQVPGSGTSSLAELSDGTLMLLTGGALYRVNLANWTVDRTTIVSGTLLAISPAGAGKIWMLERRIGTFAVLLDVESNKVLSRHAAPYPGRFYVRSTPSRLYLGTSAVFDGLIQAFDVNDGALTARGVAGRDDNRLLRGGLHLTPDGRQLVTGNGHVFHAPRAER